ncbi:hypothetical protein TPHA_0O01900 [Tetrapisispora phaffii CBS 4417]|uniref:Guanine deaminase n=1 Tax=Tetrapisispora phaffii (strain ATCC 24235 / CBS 4417 / NBRC 1672 / NRRL Y-8282 / UCD 70-5) TaxID=1071381 RepID=G8C1X9_TETPH|nr:hypothetical protein TPHA_0O01900 [Tetrapisispora phaffii CBS 4417]CCE66157.1 hypothetical protein TPHA_0O01900 [Tetrapisispora phaffii CBS 4417]
MGCIQKYSSFKVIIFLIQDLNIIFKGNLHMVQPLFTESAKNTYSNDDNLREEKFRVFYGTFVDTPVLGEFRIRYQTSVGVESRSGTILFINENSSDPMGDVSRFDPTIEESNVEVIELKSHFTSFFFPGFIDTHIHASQYPNTGIFGKSTLLDWLIKYTFPLEQSLENDDISKDVYTKIVKRTLSHGTTTACYYTTIHASSAKIMAQICSKLGQRAMIGKVCMDLNSPDFYTEKNVNDSLKSTLDVVDYIFNEIKKPIILPVLTPRFAPSCSRELMLGLSKIASSYPDGLHIQTHLSENIKEINWAKELFPECKSYTEIYNKYGMLSNKTILAHCIHLDDDEIKLIKENKSGISHCPISNSSLTSGECKVRELLNENIKIGLGTDVSAGYSTSILDNARQAHLVSRHLAMKYDNREKRDSVKLSVEDVLYLATLGGAKVLELDDKIGTFDIGKHFDTQLIDLNVKGSPVDVFDWQIPDINNGNENDIFTLKELLYKWFFNSDDRNVAKVWVDGLEVISK